MVQQPVVGFTALVPGAEDIYRIVKQFDQMKKMMKQLPGMMGGGKRRGLGGMFGKMKLPF